MFSRIHSLRGEKGFTLIELLIVIAIIGILAAIAIPQFSAYKNRAYDSQAKGDLHNVYLACKAYWADGASTDSCGLADATTATYGFIQNSNVTVAISNGTENAFAATASHSSSNQSFAVDQNGNIT
ncbi:MAG: prepilin-type N-terminal cleavage/methylation domain-containing protein [Nitrospinales bacterium]